MALDFLEWVAAAGPHPVDPQDLYNAHFESYLSRVKEDIQDERLKDWAEEPIFCLLTRFFDRFCVPFGLTEPATKTVYTNQRTFSLRRFFPQIIDRL